MSWRLRGNKLQVLLVEGESEQRWLGAQLLSLAGDLEVTVAANGVEGLELALKQRPQVILLDLILPGLSGLELLRRYRQSGGTASVIALTGAVGEGPRAEALALGVDFLFSKPVAWAEVIRRVRSCGGGLTLLCQGLLEEMGAPVRWAGFRQAARCAALLGEDQLKAAYIQTAAQEGVSVAQVEVNIRRLIGALHAEGSPAYQALLEQMGKSGRPGNGDFLRALGQAARFRL